MQSLNRLKSDRPRREHDFYETPYELCTAALDRYKTDNFQFPRMCLDAGAGRGVWCRAANNVFGMNSYITGVELQKSDKLELTDLWFAHRWMEGTDFFSLNREDVFLRDKQELVFGNPPYSLAEEFVRKSLELVNDGGNVFFLLRLAFLESKKRYFGLYAEHPLRKVYVLSRRPSFFSTRENGKTTDTLSYAMFLWQKGWKGKTELDWLYWEYDK